MPLTIPSGLAFGTYQLRLFHNNGYLRLSTSNNFSVGPSVSGTVTLGGSPLAGVTFTATNGGSCTPSNASGQYTCAVPSGWSGSVSAALSGYVFTPASRTYSNVTAHQTAQTYAATVTYDISGTITTGGSPLANVAVVADNGGVCSASNASGQYTCAVPSGWSGNVTPSLSGYSFTPASRAYSNVQADRAAQNYAASQAYQLSGTVTAGAAALPGVTFSPGSGGSCTTSNASGQYTCTVPLGWSGTLAPSLGGYSFTPASRSYSNVTANQGAQDYAAAVIFEVSGTATLNGVPLANVAFAATNGGTCMLSNALGQYTCIVPPGWSGDVTPSASGYTFSPALRCFSNVTSNQAAQGFAATLGSGAEAIHFVHVDHLNTPRLVANAAGQTVWRWDQQEPFGNNVPDENPSGLGIFDLPLRLPGQRYDTETGLHYNYFRDYDPSLGMYKQSDPIGLKGGLNTYLYVAAAPLVQVDPRGLDNPGMGPYGDPWSGNYYTYPNATPPDPAVERQVGCISLCLGDRLGIPPPMLAITGGTESRKASGSLHPSGQAVDFGGNNNSAFTPNAGRKGDMLDCACKCGFTHGGWEPDWNPGAADHYHLQNGSGARVPKLNCNICRP